MAPIPFKIFQNSELRIRKDQDKMYNLSAIFSGVDLIYKFIKNPLDSYLTDTQVFLIEDQRGYTYDIEIEAKNISKTLSWKVSITEDLPALPNIVNNDTLSFCNNTLEINFENILSGGKHLTYTYDITYEKRFST